ncbi:galactoside 2-alpha-L-fucosyltransferase-like [Nymphaea colorata]|nr:galactoside 2-alpha-L-fucosyltransferase-like [Nymphaea colorata]
MFHFIILMLIACSLKLPIGRGGDSPYPTEFRHTLSNLSQENIRHCTSLPPTERLVCELEGAIDAQGHPTTNAKNTNPPAQPPPAKESCKFREDNIYTLYPHSMPQSPVLNRVLEKYVAMHRRCRDIDFASLDDVYTSSRRPICRYLIWRPSGYGFGNRLLALISSFLYAVMSARVLLIDYPEWDHLFCEPFLGSSIQLPARTKLNQVLGEWYIQFRDARCGLNSSNKICNTTVVNLRLDHVTGLREYESVACPMGYSRVRNIEFLTMRECNQYLVPGFYLNPVLSPLLEVLFPQRNAFHLLSRFLLVPSDAMWASIRPSLDIQASRRVGVQIREFVGRYTTAYDGNVIECIKKKGGFLPKKFRKRRVHSGEYCGVYVATLLRRHLEAVNSSLKALVVETGKEFRFNHQRLDGREVHDRKHEAEALVDMWVLSMSNVLVTSQDSSFGYIATGVGGVVPNFLDMEEGKGCFMGLGVEPCFHAAPKNLRCAQDEAVAFSLQEIVEKNTSIVKVCNDRPRGWTLLPPTVSKI